ncbi:MAG: extracellular solute-binding protein [bacterium]|nr:extracellular solute-binding protein [bacterium]
MSRFQLIFTGVLIACAVFGVALFALNRTNNSGEAPQVVLWGTFPHSLMSGFLGDARLEYRDQLNVVYVQKQAATFESELIASLARGQGPDMVLWPQDLILKQADKFFVVPFENYSERTFKDSFIEGSELYLVPGGVIGLPFSVNPMVMYWNREIFGEAGVSLPPTTWNELYALAPKVIKKDVGGGISQAMVAMGSSANIVHYKDMLALLSMQAGTPIVARDARGIVTSVFGVSQGQVPGEQAINFFTEFSNPSKPAYTWNRSLMNDRDMFIAGKLAMYFGYASELQGIRSANPNLNFDVAVIPQASGRTATFGHMTAFAFLKSSPNIGPSVSAAAILTGSNLQNLWASKSGLPPVRRDLLASTPGSAYTAVFYRSALMARAWLDPNREATNIVFERLVDNVTSGRYRASQAVSAASSEIDSIIRTNQ